MLYERWYNFSKVRKINYRKYKNIECKKQKRYIEINDILSNIY